MRFTTQGAPPKRILYITHHMSSWWSLKGVIQQLLTCGIQKQVVASDVRLLSLGKEATDKENRTEQYGLRRWVTCQPPPAINV
ncbi:hypothetical protein Pmani_017438 [Petrolisthes manimaculis]|uniref:Uncharacterized protein n=1 Tax=Petrolisthes manimaculis TaxID=1843537 RepID=A0AAE1PME4_9EUCA|nr:hypothetical protein Pmani_017438 [Petrolisthes manimaculis]